MNGYWVCWCGFTKLTSVQYETALFPCCPNCYQKLSYFKFITINKKAGAEAPAPE